MPIANISHNGKVWPKDKFVEACLTGECDYPAPIAVTILKNAGDYDNHDTISGSQLYANCDLKRLLERSYGWTEEITNMFYASYRGSNVHATIETCKADPIFKDWSFERRFFASLSPEDVIAKIDVPMKPVKDGFGIADDYSPQTEDWAALEVICNDLRAKGHIILSGALDSIHVSKGRIWDWKTASSIGRWTDVKPEWTWQMSMYALLAKLHGMTINDCRITVMDATNVLVLEVTLFTSDEWVREKLIPRIRQLDAWSKLPDSAVQAINEGKIPPIDGFPLPVKSYLCEGGKDKYGKPKKIYCAMRTNVLCPAWKKEASPVKLKVGPDFY